MRDWMTGFGNRTRWWPAPGGRFRHDGTLAEEAWRRTGEIIATLPPVPGAAVSGWSATPPRGRHEILEEVIRGLSAIMVGMPRISPDSAGPDPTLSDQPQEIVFDLIACCDQADSLEREPTEARAASTARWLTERLQQMLATYGVTPVQDSGLVDPDRQEVVAVEPTGDRALAQHITATARPGYAWRDRVIRPQWVVIHRASDDPAEADPSSERLPNV